MGAGYKTAIPQYVDDKMFQLPFQLMGQVLQTKTAGVDKAYEEEALFGDMLKMKYRTADRDRAREILAQYEDEGDSVARLIDENPANYKKHLRKIKDITRKLEKDMEGGEWAAIEGNYAADVELAKKAAEMGEKEGYGIDYANRVYSAHNSNAKATDYDADTGAYNKYGTAEFRKMEDLYDYVDKTMTGFKADGKKMKWDKVAGQWIVGTEVGGKFVGEGDLLSLVGDRISSDPEQLKAMRQRQDLGLLGSVFNDDGSMNVSTGKTAYKNEQGNVIENYQFADNEFARAVAAGVNKHGFDDRVYNTDLKGNPNWKDPNGGGGDDEDGATGIDIGGIKTEMSNGVHTVEDLESLKATGIGNQTRALNDGVQLMKNALGLQEDQELDPDIMKALRTGNFDLIREYDPEITTQAVNRLETTYKAGIRERMLAQQIEKQFAEAQGFNTESLRQTPDYTEMLKTAKEDGTYDDYLDSIATGSTDQKLTWPEGTSTAQKKLVKKETVSSVQNGQVSFKIEGKDSYTGTQEMIDAGIIQPNIKKLTDENPEYMPLYRQHAQITQEISRMRAEGNDEGEAFNKLTNQKAQLYQQLIGIDELDYKFVPGADLTNFQLDEDTVKPESVLDQDNSLNLRASGMMNGNTVNLIVHESASFPELRKFRAENDRELRINAILAKNKGIKQLPVLSGEVDEDGTPLEMPGSYIDFQTGHVIIKEGDKTRTLDIHSNSAAPYLDPYGL